MMEVVCRGPFRASTFLWQPAQGALAAAVICKATFTLTPGESPYHVEPVDVLPADVHHEDDPRRSVARASDFVPAKKRPELLLTGHAHAPLGRPIQSLLARVAFQDIDKTIAIVGDSHIALDNTISEPVPFIRMSLRWERASAGPDGQNPAGVRMGREARADAWGRVFLPNQRPPGARFSSRWDVLPAVGFGPIAPDWPARAARLPRRAQPFDPRSVLRWPLPPDFDMAFFNAAPPDQLTDEISGDEQLILENLLPGVPRLVTRLARLVPRAHAELTGGGHAAMDLRCDTLTVDTDQGIATLVWRGNLPVDHPERVARVIVSGQALTSHIAVSAPVSAPVRATIGLSAPPSSPVLPFSARSDAAPPSAPAAPEEPAVALNNSARIPEPEPPAPDPAEPEGEEAEPVFPETHRRTVDLAAWLRPGDVDPLPFRPAPASRPAAPIEPPEPPPPPAMPAMPALLQTGPVPELYAAPPPPEPRPREPEFAPPPTPEGKEPAPPPMLGPIQPQPPGADAEAAAEDKAKGSTLKSESPPSFDDYPIELCARTAARIDLLPDDKIAILDKIHLTPAEWDIVATHWQAEMRREGARGKTKLLTAYDAAYVGELEAVRGPITPAEYARLVIAAGRGTADDLLDEMALPRGGFARIRRVWVRRVVADAAVAKEVRAATQAAAEE